MTVSTGMTNNGLDGSCVATDKEYSSPTSSDSLCPDLSRLSEAQRRQLQKKQYAADSDQMISKFQDLLDTIMNSLEEREVPVSKIVARIMGYGSFEPVFKGSQQPILQNRFEEMKAAKTIDDVMFIVSQYSSFFNYHLIERIIKSLGTNQDKKKFEEYEEEFKKFANCMVCQCQLGTTVVGDDQTTFFVKLNDSFDNCTVSHLKKFCMKFTELLQLRIDVLQLVSVKQGCLELTFQVPSFVYQAIFPLSAEQESVLIELGIIKISAGEYEYNSCRDEVDLAGSNSKHDKPDDDSAIEVRISSLHCQSLVR